MIVSEIKKLPVGPNILIKPSLITVSLQPNWLTTSKATSKLPEFAKKWDGFCKVEWLPSLNHHFQAITSKDELSVKEEINGGQFEVEPLVKKSATGSWTWI